MPQQVFTPKFTITNTTTKALTQIERARGFLEAATLSEEWLRAMGQRALLLEAHYTTHIEGTHLTLEQSEQAFDGQTLPDSDPNDIRELLNYRRAFDLVADYLNSGQPVTEGLIREIHKRLVSGVRGGSAKPGQYRLVQNYVANAVTKKVIYTPPPPQDVPVEMEQLVRWLNTSSDIHPVLISGIAQFQLVHIHPFVDGNGRTSRLLSTLCLYRAGYDFKRLFTISEYYDRDRAKFYGAIQSVRKSKMDMTGWLEYFTDGLATQMREVTGRGQQAIKQDIFAKEHHLNVRQSAAMDLILVNGKMTIAEFENLYPNISRRTLQRDIKYLVEAGICYESASSPTDPTKGYALVANETENLL
ncbi:cell division protein Fic [Planctomycetales bacterium]|nr:cell division protein Fic [Planctomycetales bacterium]